LFLLIPFPSLYFSCFIFGFFFSSSQPFPVAGRLFTPKDQSTFYEIVSQYPKHTVIMQFSIVALLSLAAVAIAGPVAIPQRLDGTFFSSMSNQTEESKLTRVSSDLTARNVVSARQVPAEAAAMTDAQGNVVLFDSASVNKGTFHPVHLHSFFTCH
jgi:hypothetical protein